MVWNIYADIYENNTPLSPTFRILVGRGDSHIQAHRKIKAARSVADVDDVNGPLGPEEHTHYPISRVKAFEILEE
jgi:hypothetical protein